MDNRDYAIKGEAKYQTFIEERAYRQKRSIETRIDRLDRHRSCQDLPRAFVNTPDEIAYELSELRENQTDVVYEQDEELAQVIPGTDFLDTSPLTMAEKDLTPPGKTGRKKRAKTRCKPKK
jgi:hypothetical protein